MCKFYPLSYRDRDISEGMRWFLFLFPVSIHPKIVSKSSYREAYIWFFRKNLLSSMLTTISLFFYSGQFLPICFLRCELLSVQMTYFLRIEAHALGVSLQSRQTVFENEQNGSLQDTAGKHPATSTNGTIGFMIASAANIA